MKDTWVINLTLSAYQANRFISLDQRLKFENLIKLETRVYNGLSMKIIRNTVRRCSSEMA